MFDPRHANSGKRLRCASLTGNVDFAPTLLELAGLPVPQNMDGRSLLKLYNDPKSETHQSLPLINVWGPKAVHSYAVVTKDWKYIYWPYAEGELEAADELYHLAEDRLELNNVLRDSDAREALAEMRKTYDAAVTAWKKESVPYHSYKQYGTIFDRHVKWAKNVRCFWACKNERGGLIYSGCSMTLLDMENFSPNRRQFLKGAGVAMALPLLESLPEVRAAQKAARAKGPVKRFVCLSNNYGIYRKGFFPSTAGADYALTPTLKPLERHRKEFTVSPIWTTVTRAGTRAYRCCSVACGHTWRRAFRRGTSASTRRWPSMSARPRGFLR